MSDVAALLAEHVHGEFLSSLSETWTACRCGAKIDAGFGGGRGTAETFRANWSAHLAAVLDDHIAQQQAAAWDEGFMDAAGQDHPAYPRTRGIDNPYRKETDR